MHAILALNFSEARRRFLSACTHDPNSHKLGGGGGVIEADHNPRLYAHEPLAVPSQTPSCPNRRAPYTSLLLMISFRTKTVSEQASPLSRHSVKDNYNNLLFIDTE